MITLSGLKVTGRIQGSSARTDWTPPTFASATTATAVENQNVLYTAYATDTTSSVVYSLVAGGDAHLLNVDPAGGVVTLKTGVLDYESAKTTYAFTVQATDVAGNTAQRAVTVSVTDDPADNPQSWIATPTATPAAFGDAFEGGYYTGMIWNQLTQSSTSTAIGTGAKTFTVPDQTSAPLVYSGQLLEIRSRANPTNKMVGVVTGASGTTLTMNITSVGGSGTFSDWSIMCRYRIIVAPKATGENAAIRLKNANTAMPTATQTLSEGWLATNAMYMSGNAFVYPAAHWARGLNIAGRTDWYIPARDELELCWRNLKPTTDANYVVANRPASSYNYTTLGAYGDTADTSGLNHNSSPAGAAYTTSNPGQVANTAFRTGGAEAFEYGSGFYWSSTEYSAADAWYQLWYSSVPGGQYYNSKTNASRVRAVRRSPI